MISASTMQNMNDTSKSHMIDWLTPILSEVLVCSLSPLVNIGGYIPSVRQHHPKYTFNSSPLFIHFDLMLIVTCSFFWSELSLLKNKTCHGVQLSSKVLPTKQEQ